jgi:hypothetical protein
MTTLTATALFLDGVTDSAQTLREMLVSASLSGAPASGSTGIAARQGIRPGVGSPLLVAASSGMTVAVSAGVAYVQGTASTTAGMYTVVRDTSGTITLATSDPTNPRIDNIIARVVDNGDNTSTATIEPQAGTPAPSPVAPTLPANSLLLAQIAVAAATSSIVGGNITDKRVATAAMGGIIPVKDASDQPQATAEAPAFRWRRDVTAAAGGTSPLETSTGSGFIPIFDASVVPTTTTSAITSAVTTALGKLPNYTSSTRPGSPATGLEIWETDTGHAMLWTGSAWVQTYPVPAAAGWTAMTMQSGWTAGTGGATPQFNYNAATGTVALRGKITSTSGSGTGSLVIATNMPTTSQIQYMTGCTVTAGIPINFNISGALLGLVVTTALSAGDGVFLGGCYLAL